MTGELINKAKTLRGIEKLRAERDRYWQALNEIAEPHPAHDIEYARKTARQALGDNPHD